MKLESAVFLAGAAMLAALSPAARADCVVPCLDNACGSSASKICCTYLPIFSGFPTQTPRSPSHTDMHQHIRNVARVATPPPRPQCMQPLGVQAYLQLTHECVEIEARVFSQKILPDTKPIYNLFYFSPSPLRRKVAMLSILSPVGPNKLASSYGIFFSPRYETD